MNTTRSDPFIPDRRTRTAIFATLIVALLLFCWFDVRLRSSLSSNSANSFTVYFTAARAIAEGESLYGTANIRGWTYVYPPFFAVLLTFLLPMGSSWAGMTWFALSAAMAFGAYFESARIVRAVVAPDRLPLPPWLAAGPTLALALPGISCLQGGQVGLALLWLELVALRLVLEERKTWHDMLAGVVLAIAIAIKVTPALPAAVLLLHFILSRAGTRRVIMLSAGLALGSAATFVGVPSLALGVTGNAHALAEFVQRIAIDHRVIGIEAGSNQSLWFTLPRAAATAGLDAAWWPSAGRVVAMAAVASTAIFAALFATNRPADRALTFSMAMAMTILASPVAWVNHYVVAAAIFLVLPLRHHLSGRSRTALGFLVAAVAVIVCHYALRVLDRDVYVLSLGFALWMVAAIAVLVAERHIRSSVP